ncbi:MAG: hypothetical protein FWE08_03340 [Oscillospiraceae bacterium]|nr:hypothetical protein [Oscillospiraceae bacterium]
MTRDEINQVIAQAAGVDTVTTERVLVGLEKVVIAQMSRGGNKFGRMMLLYQNWKGK